MTGSVIPLNKSRLVLLVAGALAFVGTSVWIWSVAGGRSDPFAAKCVAVAGAAFFGACAIWGCLKLFDGRPGLVIDAEGIVDNSSAVAAGRIPWADLTGVRVGSIGGQRYLTLLVRDPRKYVARGGPLKRLLNAANTKLTGSPINISATALRVRFDDLERTLSDALRSQDRRGDG